jgi:hypothetical protein
MTVTVIDDLNDWLPPYGESAVSFSSSDSRATLVVEYERRVGMNHGEIARYRRDIEYSGALYFYGTPMPGYDPFSEPTPKFPLGALVEFHESRFLESCSRVWREISGRSVPRFRHFYVRFMSENRCFHVIATEVHLSDAYPVTIAEQS